MKDNKKALFLAIAAVLSWSTVATAFKIALTHLTHFEMLWVACATSLVIFSVMLTVQRKWVKIKALSWRMWGYFALLGLLNPVAYYLVLFKSYDLLPAQIAQPVNYMWPVLLVVLLAIFTKQPIPAKKYIGMLISLGGLIVISVGGKQMGSMEIPAVGLGLGIMSAFLWAIYWMVNNRNKDKVDATVACFMSFLFGSVYLSIGALVVGLNLSTVPGILSGIYVGAFEMGIPFICFGIAIRKTSNPTLINQLCYLSPFLSLFFVSTILGEQIVSTTYIGLVLIVTGIVFNEYFVKQKDSR